MKINRAVYTLLKSSLKPRYMFCKKNADKNVQQEKQQNRFIKFLKDGWRQTFPDQQDEVKRKYKKVKQIKRYTQEELRQMQEKIPQYQRTAMVETQQKIEQKKSKFKISQLIPESVRQKLSQTQSYKQYTQFKQNLKQYVNTSNSATINIGTKAYNLVSQPSSAVKATEAMRQYDKQFNLMELQKQSTFIFRDAYQQYLQNNVEALQMLCGEQALDMFKALIKINTEKKVRPKYTQLLHHDKSRHRKTITSESSLPSFLFQINIMEIYCMIDAQGKIVDGDDERVTSSTFQFLLKYSGTHIAELGHPWQITQFRKIDQVKLLV